MDNKLKSSNQVLLICLAVTIAFTASAVMFAISSFKNTAAYIKHTTDMTTRNIVDDIDRNMSAPVLLAKSYNVNIAFSDLKGDIIMSNEPALPEGANIFKEGGLFEGYEPAANPSDISFTVKWTSNDLFDTNRHFCEMKYIKAFNWYLIVYGGGNTIMRMNRNQVFMQLALLGLLLVLTIAIIINTILRYRNRIISLATMDELTKIMNRKSFMARFEYFSKQNLLTGGHIFLIDIDFFKTINDTLGHAAGDEALAFLSEKLASHLGKDGFIARWGGDEFIGVFFSNIKDPISKIKNLAADITDTETGKRLHLTLSVGVALLEDGLPLNKEVEKADIALYTSKKNGRNQATMYDESQTGAEPEYSKELIENSKKNHEKED